MGQRQDIARVQVQWAEADPVELDDAFGHDMEMSRP